MNMQQQIDRIKNALAAVDNAISQTQLALQSPSTTSDDIRALRSTLIDLQAQRSQLQTDLINLQASQTELSGLTDDSSEATQSRGTMGPKLTRAQSANVDTLHKQLSASIVDRSVVTATIEHATAVTDRVSQLRTLLNGTQETRNGQRKAASV